MGGSSSKLEYDPNTNMEIVLDKGVKEQIDKLSEYVGYFNKSDVSSLLDVIDVYGNKLETSTGESYDLKNVKQFVKSFHGDILKKISSEHPSSSSEERELKFKERIKDTKLPEYLKTIYDEKLENLKKEISESTFLQKDPASKSNIVGIFNNIAILKSKYKYFEYKYIQLNLFMVIFIQHVFKTLDRFINTVLSYIVAEDKKRSDTLSKLINLLINIMNQADLTINQNDFNAIDKLMSVVEKEVKEKQTSLTDAISKAKVEAMDDMIKIINSASSYRDTPSTSTSFTEKRSRRVDDDDNYSDDIMESLNDLNMKSRSLSRSQISPKDYDNKPIDLNAEARAQPRRIAPQPDEFIGGFIRGNARLPQAFYELKH